MYTTEDDRTNGDGVGDGRELLIFGGVPPGVPAERPWFAEFMKRWNGQIQALKFDEQNPWELDPLNPNSDSDLDDIVPDGQDLNPRGDAFFRLRFDGLLVDDDGAADMWETKFIELYFDEIIIDLPVAQGDFVVHLPSSDAVDVPAHKKWADMPDGLLAKVAQKSAWQLADRWGAAKDPDAQIPEVRFNIPDSVEKLDVADLKVTVSVHAKDDDWIGDNGLDFNPRQDSQHAIHEFDLAADLNRVPASLEDEEIGYLVWQPEEFIEHVGDARDWTDENDEDGRLRLRAGDTIPKYFLDLVTGKLNMSNACYGDASCISRR